MRRAALLSRARRVRVDGYNRSQGVTMRFKKPSPSMVVASIALFVSLGGTSVAAVSYARNAGKVDGYDAVKASSSTSKAAGNLVAANKSGADKGKIPAKHLADVGVTQTFGRSFDVADNAPGAPVQIGDGGSLGRLTATCNDQAPRAGVEDPTTELNFVNTSGDFINVARRAGIRDDAAYNAIPNGTVAQLVINGSNTFLFHVEYRGRNLLVNGVVRQDGRGTPTASCLVWGTVQEIAP
jgi:hypothetical protein